MAQNNPYGFQGASSSFSTASSYVNENGAGSSSSAIAVSPDGEISSSHVTVFTEDATSSSARATASVSTDNPPMTSATAEASISIGVTKYDDLVGTYFSDRSIRESDPLTSRSTGDRSPFVWGESGGIDDAVITDFSRYSFSQETSYEVVIQSVDSTRNYSGQYNPLTNPNSIAYGLDGPDERAVIQSVVLTQDVN